MPVSVNEFKLNPLDGSTTTEYGDGSITTGSILPAATLTADDTAKLRAAIPAAPLMPYAVMASPPAVSVGAANAASAIAGSTLIPPGQVGAFRYSGGAVLFDRGGSRPTIGKYTGTTSQAYGAIEFVFETTDATGRFELSIRGDGDASRGRLLYRKPGDSTWQAFSVGPSYTIPIDGNGYLVLVTLGAAGKYEIRLEGVRALLNGVAVPAGSSITAMPPKAGPRVIVPGDSFTEPTLNETSLVTCPADGWASQLGFLTGLDVWPAGKGGTGFLNGGAGNTYRERWTAELQNYVRPRDIVLIAGGINDSNRTYAEVYAEALTLFQMVMAKGAFLRVVSPFYPKGANKAGVTAFWSVCDAVKDACAAAGGKYIDLISLPQHDFTASFGGTTVVQTGVSSRLVVGDIPAAYKPGTTTTGGQWWKIGSGVNQQIARSTYINGSEGAWQIEFEGVTYANWPIGTPVTTVGASYQTGSGKQGAVAGDGNSDLFTGPDGTHPTRAGHLNISKIVAPLFLASF